MTKIHPTAVVEDGAQIAASAEIGPFCWISSKAKIGENVRLLARVTVYGDTTIGEGTVVSPGLCWEPVRRIMAMNFKMPSWLSVSTMLFAKT